MRPPLHTQDEASRIALAAIIESVDQRGFPPSVREISKALGWDSPSQGHIVVKRLIEQGLVTTVPGITRSIRITGAGMKAVTEVM